MRRISVLVFPLVVCLTGAMHGQTPAPKPDPEFQRLQALVGRWMFNGAYKPGAWGPGSKIRGEYTARFILKGFAFEGRTVERSVEGETHFLEIDAYDPVNKNITFSVRSDVGTAYSGAITIAGRTITWEGTVAAAGREYRVEEVVEISGDRMSATAKAEISTDGKMWMPYFDGKFRKVEPVAKRSR